jgi:hypothetical protein
MTSPEDSIYDLIIIGGGLSGLSLAESLPTLSILILEAQDYVGGRVCSNQLKGVYAELGAIFPFNPARPSDPDGLLPTRPLGMYENGLLYLGRDPFEILCNANRGSTFDFSLLTSFASPHLSLLNGSLKIPNESFGDLKSFPDRVKNQIDAFHRVIHPASAHLYSRAIVGDALVNWPCLFNEEPNSTIVNILLEKLGDRVTLRTGCLVSQVSPKPCGLIEVNYQNNSVNLSAKSRLCAITTPGKQMLGILQNFLSANYGFYRDVAYASGMVCAVAVEESSELPRLIVSTDQAWSSMIPLTRGGRTILHFYITGANAVSLWSSADDEIVNELMESIRSISLVEKHLGATVRRWREVGPILSEQLKASYYPKHYRLAQNLWFAGEMALYTPSAPLSYGMAAAIMAGKMIASDILTAQMPVKG